MMYSYLCLYCTTAKSSRCTNATVVNASPATYIFTSLFVILSYRTEKVEEGEENTKSKDSGSKVAERQNR